MLARSNPRCREGWRSGQERAAHSQYRLSTYLIRDATFFAWKGVSTKYLMFVTA